MKWFEIIATEENTAWEVKYCIQAHDAEDAADWVVEDIQSNIDYRLSVTELLTEVEVMESQLKSDIVFWGD